MKQSYKWCLLGLLCCSYFFHQADRALFGLLTIPIQVDLGLTDTQIGLVNTALFCTLAVMNPLAGLLGDRFSRKWIITFSLLFWSLMTACTGLVGGMLGLVFIRSVATGGGESFYGPSASALIAGHHRETRSLAFAIHQSALYVGLMLSGSVVAWALKVLGGWRWVFAAFGGSGLLLGIVFVFALKDGQVHSAVAEKRTDARNRPSLKESLSAYFGNPAALCLTGGFLAIVFANNAYLSWAPKFVARKFDLEVGVAGSGAMLYHHLAALLAILCGAVVTDRQVRKHPRFRLVLQAIALLSGAPMLMMIGVSDGLTGCWLAMACYGVFRGMFEANTHASLFDVVPSRHRSSAYGMMTMIAFFVGSVSPLMMGALSDRYGIRGFQFGFIVLGICYVIGALLLVVSSVWYFERYRVRD